MTFDEILEQVIALLKSQKRVSYGALRRRYDLDEGYLADLKDEIIHAQRLAIDEDNRLLVWAENAGVTPEPTSPPEQTTQPDTKDAQPTQAEPPPTEPHTTDAERRQLTLLFTDLVESTALSGQMDAEDYREIVRAYQAACAEVIERYECHLAQTLGDGLLIYSGYPVAHENDAERAVRVGLGIIDAMKALNERLEREKDIRLGVRVGIHTGPVVVGDVGAGARQEQLALGEVPNVAARIQGLAEPDTVVISDATYRLIQGYFDCESLGKRELRGVAEPVVVYQVLRESGVQGRLDIASTRGLTPLVGREQEVGLLLERWEQVKTGQGQVVLLSGEAGIGKSRLVQALKDHVGEQAHIRLECRSSPYFTNSALYPIIDMVQRTLRFQSDDTPEQKLEKLEQHLSQYRLPLDETVPLFGALLSLSVPEDQYPPLNITPQLQRQKTLEAIVAITLELAEPQPVLFILDDAHWTDPTTIEFIDLLLDQTPTASLLLLITYRPEFQSTWGNRSYLTQLTLNRLSQPQIERMAKQVAGEKGLPAEVIQQLVDKTDGVPLFVEEMTKSVLESGLLKESDGRYDLTSSISTLFIPTTLQDSLMARLDRLITAKAVAQYAAVIGRQFSYALLQAVSELDEVALQRELNRLVEAELVYQRGLPPHATYTFKHALVQDTAYESLLRSTRQSYHRRIAEILEGRFPETVKNQPELLAHHYTEAGMNESAFGYWHQTALRAQERSAHHEAIHHLTQEINLLSTLPDSTENALRELDAQLALASSLGSMNGWATPVVEQPHRRARELCEQLGDTSKLYSVLLGQHSFYLVRADFQIAQELTSQRFQIAQESQNSFWQFESHRTQGHLYVHLGALMQARHHFELSLDTDYAQQPTPPITWMGGQDPRMFIRSWLAMTLWLLGYPGQATRQIEDALEVVQEFSTPSNMISAFGYANWLFVLQRNPLKAEELSQKIWTLASEHGFAQHLAQGKIRLGLEQIEQGDEESGEDLVHQGLEEYRQTGALARVPMFLGQLASAYETARKPEEGLSALAEALEISEQTGEHWWNAEIHRLKGQILLQQSPGNATEAESCFQQAISIAQNQSAKSWELRAATSLAKLWQSQGKQREAYDLLAPVYNWFTEGFDTADLIDAKTLLDELS